MISLLYKGLISSILNDILEKIKTYSSLQRKRKIYSSLQMRKRFRHNCYVILNKNRTLISSTLVEHTNIFSKKISGNAAGNFRGSDS